MFFKNKEEALNKKEIEKELKLQEDEINKQEEELKKQEEFNKILLEEKYIKTIQEMIIEEIRLPGTHKTYFKVDRIGEGLFWGFSKTTEEATKFLNEIIYNQKQVINICARGDDSLLQDYIVTYWKIDDRNKIIYNQIKEEIKNELL